MGRNEEMKIKLQLFGEENGSENEAPENENQEKNNEGEKKPDKSNEKITELEKKINSMSDLIKTLSEVKNETKEDEKNENKKEEKNSKETKLEKRVEELQKIIKATEIKNFAEKELLKEGMGDFTDSLIPLLISSDEEKTKENIKIIKTVIDKSVEKKIEEIKKGKGFQGNSEGAKDDLEKELKSILNIKEENSDLSSFWK